jgi:S1-C subfamily serine protease
LIEENLNTRKVTQGTKVFVVKQTTMSTFKIENTDQNYRSMSVQNAVVQKRLVVYNQLLADNAIVGLLSADALSADTLAASTVEADTLEAGAVEAGAGTFESIVAEDAVIQTSTTIEATAQSLTAEKLKDDTALNIWAKRDAVVSVYMKYGPPISKNFVASGFFVSADGYVVTAAHNVIDSDTTTTPAMPNLPRQMAFEVYVSITNMDGIPGNNQEVQMEIVGTDGAGDIAVLRPMAPVVLTNQAFLTWGDSRAASVGDAVIVMGDPLGIDQQSISKGVIRDNTFMLNVTVEAIMFDASVVGGNSGGPFMDINGNVLGITTFGYDGTTTLVGGVAQHIAQRVSESLIQSADPLPRVYNKGFLGWKLGPMLLGTKNLYRTSFPPGDSTSSMDGQFVAAFLPPDPVPGGYPQLPLYSPIVSVDGIDMNIVSESNKEQVTNITWFKIPGETVEVVWRDPVSGFSTNTSTLTLLPFPVGYEVPLLNASSAPALSLLMPLTVASDP